MPSIGEFSYGHDKNGVAQYVADIKAESLDEAGTIADDTSGIKAALDATWEGKAKDSYINNLTKDVKIFKESLKTLYDKFCVEITNASLEMQNFADHLID